MLRIAINNNNSFEYVPRLKRRKSFCTYNATTFEKQNSLGEGSYGQVFRMTSVAAANSADPQPAAPTEVAVKLIQPKLIFPASTTHEEIRKIIEEVVLQNQKEAVCNKIAYGIGEIFMDPKALAIVKHDSVKYPYITLDSPPKIYMVMPYHAGVRLDEIKYFHTFQQYLNATKAILYSLIYLHEEKNIVHEDIHRGNILLTKNGADYKASLIDFTYGCFLHEKFAYPPNIKSETKAPELQIGGSLTAEFNHDYYALGVLLEKVLNRQIKKLPAEDKLMFTRLTSDLAAIYDSMTVDEPEDRWDPRKALAQIKIFEENFQTKLIAQFKLLQASGVPFDVEEWLILQGFISALEKPDADAYELLENYLDEEYDFLDAFTKDAGLHFSLFISTLQSSPKCAERLALLKHLAANGLPPSFLETPEKFNNLLNLFADDRETRREFCIIVLESYQANLQQQVLFHKNASLMDKWCFAERLLIGLKKNPDYSLTYLTSSLEQMLHTSLAANVGILNLTQRGIESLEEFFVVLEKLSIGDRTGFLAHIDSLPTKEIFYRQLQISRLLTEPGFESTDSPVEQPALPFLLRLSSRIGEDAFDKLLSVACQQFFTDSNLSFKEALKTLDVFSYHSKLYRNILMACNEVYIIKRSASELSRYSMFSVYSQAAKVKAASRIADKFNAFELDKNDLLNPVLNQGELGEIVGRLRTTF